MCGRGRFAILAAYEVDQYARGCSNERLGCRIQQHDSSDDKGGVCDPLDDSNEILADKYKLVENLSPGMECSVICKIDSKFTVETMIWGIIPTYLNSPSANDHYRMFNKRIESLEASEIYPYFKTVLQTKRCVVVLDGFYEWKEVAGKKHPYYVSLTSSKPMKMAGIYEDSIIFDPLICGLRPAKTFSIITGEPCIKFSTMHNRQPILLTDEQVTQWLDCPGEDIFKLINELKVSHLNASLPMNRAIHFYPVSPKVTNPRYQESDCTQQKSIGVQLTSFFKSTIHGAPDRLIGTGRAKIEVKTDPSERTGAIPISAAESQKCEHEDQLHDKGMQTIPNSSIIRTNVLCSSATLGHKRSMFEDTANNSATGKIARNCSINDSCTLNSTTKPVDYVEKEVINLMDSPPRSVSVAKAAVRAEGGMPTAVSASMIHNAQSKAPPTSSPTAKTKPITSFFLRSPKKT